MQELRCADCGKLLCRQVITDGKLEIKCKCGKLNIIEIKKPDVREPYQQRLGLQKKRSA